MISENIELDISASAVWQEQFPEYGERIAACFEQILEHVPEAQNFERFTHLELSILLGEDQDIRQLNKNYRDKEQATNVLSFPSLSQDEIDLSLKQDSEIPVTLGDIIFAFETIKSEALDQGKSFSDHFCHLCLHGMLHLLGYDHMEDVQAEEMEALEKNLLSKLSIDDPYQD